MRLIGITGKARAGKDTFAKALIKHGYQRIAFADALKHATAVVADEPPELYFDEVAKEEYTDALEMTRREGLQNLGKAAREAFGTSVWVRRALRGWVADGRPAACITDVRYDNEAQAIAALGGHIVRIVRPDNVGLTGTAAQHESEVGVSDDLIDVEITNSGTIGDLWSEAGKLRALLDADSERE